MQNSVSEIPYKTRFGNVDTSVCPTAAMERQQAPRKEQMIIQEQKAQISELEAYTAELKNETEYQDKWNETLNEIIGEILGQLESNQNKLSKALKEFGDKSVGLKTRVTKLCRVVEEALACSSAQLRTLRTSSRSTSRLYQQPSLHRGVRSVKS